MTVNYFKKLFIFSGIVWFGNKGFLILSIKWQVLTIFKSNEQPNLRQDLKDLYSELLTETSHP